MDLIRYWQQMNPRKNLCTDKIVKKVHEHSWAPIDNAIVHECDSMLPLETYSRICDPTHGNDHEVQYRLQIDRFQVAVFGTHCVQEPKRRKLRPKSIYKNA